MSEDVVVGNKAIDRDLAIFTAYACMHLRGALEGGGAFAQPIESDFEMICM